jgi:hypothetical protein
MLRTSALPAHGGLPSDNRARSTFFDWCDHPDFDLVRLIHFHCRIHLRVDNDTDPHLHIFACSCLAIFRIFCTLVGHEDNRLASRVLDGHVVTVDCGHGASQVRVVPVAKQQTSEQQNH